MKNVSLYQQAEPDIQLLCHGVYSGDYRLNQGQINQQIENKYFFIFMSGAQAWGVETDRVKGRHVVFLPFTSTDILSQAADQIR